MALCSRRSWSTTRQKSPAVPAKRWDSFPELSSPAPSQRARPPATRPTRTRTWSPKSGAEKAATLRSRRSKAASGKPARAATPESRPPAADTADLAAWAAWSFRHSLRAIVLLDVPCGVYASTWLLSGGRRVVRALLSFAGCYSRRERSAGEPLEGGSARQRSAAPTHGSPHPTRPTIRLPTCGHWREYSRMSAHVTLLRSGRLAGRWRLPGRLLCSSSAGKPWYFRPRGRGLATPCCAPVRTAASRALSSEQDASVGPAGQPAPAHLRLHESARMQANSRPLSTRCVP